MRCQYKGKREGVWPKGLQTPHGRSRQTVCRGWQTEPSAEAENPWAALCWTSTSLEKRVKRNFCQNGLIRFTQRFHEVIVRVAKKIKKFPGCLSLKEPRELTEAITQNMMAAGLPTPADHTIIPSRAGVAQGQSSWFVISRSVVQFHSPAPFHSHQVLANFSDVLIVAFSDFMPNPSP